MHFFKYLIYLNTNVHLKCSSHQIFGEKFKCFHFCMLSNTLWAIKRKESINYKTTNSTLIDLMIEQRRQWITNLSHTSLQPYTEIVDVSFGQTWKTTAIRRILKPLGPSQHSILLKSLRGAFNWVPIVPRDTRLSDRGCNFCIPEF